MKVGQVSSKQRVLSSGLGRFLVLVPLVLCGCVFFGEGYRVDSDTNTYLNTATYTKIIQPLDGDGQPIGGPVSIPPGESHSWDDGADILSWIEWCDPPESVPGSTQRKHGMRHESVGSGEARSLRYDVLAFNAQEAVQKFRMVLAGQSPSGTTKTAEYRLSRINGTTAKVTAILPNLSLVDFEVVKDGITVASTVTGVGSPTITPSGPGYSSAVFNNLAYPWGQDLDIIIDTKDYQGTWTSVPVGLVP